MDEPVVLVVDDSPTVRAIVQRTLMGEHLQVVTAAEGLSALSAVAEASPDLILLDVMLPRMYGYQVCHLLRQHRESRQTPILFRSVKDGVFDRCASGQLERRSTSTSHPIPPSSRGWSSAISEHLPSGTERCDMGRTSDRWGHADDS